MRITSLIAGAILACGCGLPATVWSADATAPKAEAPKVVELTGTIKSVATDEASLVVIAADKKEVTVKMTKDTKILVGDQEGTAKDLVANAAVTASCSGDTATKLVVKATTK